MNSDFPERHSAKPSYNRLKQLLIVILFSSAIIGYVSTVFILRPKKSQYCTVTGKQPASNPKTPVRLQEPRQKALFSGKEKPVICQGVIITTNGQLRAVFNGKPIASGKKSGRVRILEVTTSNVLVECNGQQRRLLPGESFVPGK